MFPAGQWRAIAHLLSVRAIAVETLNYVLWDTPWVQSLLLAVPQPSFKPLFYLNQCTLLTHSKTQLLASDYYCISSVFSFIVAQTPHYIYRSWGKLTPYKTPLFWHKNKKALLLSKQHKSILLAEMPAKRLLGHQCPRCCWRWRREPQPPGEAARRTAGANRSHP